jgi:hypothetical protein
MKKNTFEGRTNPMERNDQDRSDPVVASNPSVLAALVQDVLFDEKIPSDLPSVDVTGKDAEAVVALLGHDESEHFRTRWNEVQGKFVDEPRSAVQQADALVSDVIEKITEMFANEHSALEAQWKEGKDVSTEDLRKALQHYRSFFNRLVV